MRHLILITVLALGACAEFPLSPQDPVDGVVAEAIQATRAPAAEQKAALARAQQAFVRDTSVANRLRLAVLLTALPSPLRDDARASELLEPLADAGAPGTGRFASFLQANIAERQRLSRELERVTREREQATRERERVERERSAADRERDKREEALKQQLEALRSIERGILEREDRLRKQKVRP
jgi:hypothetical protein